MTPITNFYGILIPRDRLLGPKGIPKLRQRARDLKIKGKGHEVRHLPSPKPHPYPSNRPP